jgi:hypothetical protein
MLIADAIQGLCDEGKLFPVESLRWRGSQIRKIHVSADLHHFLETEFSDAGTNRDRRKLQALFDAFIAGDFVSATLDETIMGTDLKRLRPPAAELWEVKLGKKKFAQFRVFGRFADYNHFIALTGPVDRTNADIEAEKVRCQEAWWALFGHLSPHRGVTLDDYYSSAPISLTDP